MQVYAQKQVTKHGRYFLFAVGVHYVQFLKMNDTLSIQAKFWTITSCRVIPIKNDKYDTCSFCA